jgi:hypothetical protein
VTVPCAASASTVLPSGQICRQEKHDYVQLHSKVNFEKEKCLEKVEANSFGIINHIWQQTKEKSHYGHVSLTNTDVIKPRDPNPAQHINRNHIKSCGHHHLRKTFLHRKVAITRWKTRSHKKSTLSKHVTLDISIIILAGPNIATITLQCICYHIINQPVLIPDKQAHAQVPK